MSTSTFPEWNKIVRRNSKPGGMVIRQPANQHGAYKACPTCEGSGRFWVENGDDNGYQNFVDDLTDAPQLDQLSAEPAYEVRTGSAATASLGQTPRAATGFQPLEHPPLGRMIRQHGEATAYRTATSLLAKKYRVEIEYEPRKPPVAHPLSCDIRLPREPTDPVSFATALHELGHVVENHRADHWRNEVEASRWALDQWRSLLGNQDAHWAEWSLARYLHDYRRDAYRAGEATATQVLDEVPPELLSERLAWERVEREARL